MAEALEAVLDADKRERDDDFGHWVGRGPGGYYRDAMVKANAALAAFRVAEVRLAAFRVAEVRLRGDR